MTRLVALHHSPIDLERAPVDTVVFFRVEVDPEVAGVEAGFWSHQATGLHKQRTKGIVISHVRDFGVRSRSAIPRAQLVVASLRSSTRIVPLG